MHSIYLDHNASTPMLPEAWEAMRPYSLDHAGNPASSHWAGRRPRQALENAREEIASLIDSAADEVIFTSGATEANNLALFGLAGQPPGDIAISAVEHPSVLEPARELARRGFGLALLPVDCHGIVKPPRSWPTQIRLVSVQLANHETGAIQPVADLARSTDAPFHCDAAAAAGKIPISFRALGVTALTISAHKFHGPKGIGALLLKRDAKLRPMFFGGHQQHGTRPGTEPVALVVGMAAALRCLTRDMSSHRARVVELRDCFLRLLKEQAGPVHVNGPLDGGIPNTLNVSFPGCQADVLLMNLDLAGVACATGSACSSGSLLPSPVLKAMNVDDAKLRSALRFSFSPFTRHEDVAEAARRISLCVNKLRSTSTTP